MRLIYFLLNGCPHFRLWIPAFTKWRGCCCCCLALFAGWHLVNFGGPNRFLTLNHWLTDSTFCGNFSLTSLCHCSSKALRFSRIAWFPLSKSTIMLRCIYQCIIVVLILPFDLKRRTLNGWLFTQSFFVLIMGLLFNLNPGNIILHWMEVVLA